MHLDGLILPDFKTWEINSQLILYFMLIMLYFMLIEDLTRRRVHVCGKHQAEHFQTSVQFFLW